MPTSFQLLLEQASRAVFEEDETNFEHAVLEAKSLVREDDGAVELLEEALDLFPLGEALECVRAAGAHLTVFKKHRAKN